MKKQLFVIFSAILFLSSCSWLNNDPIQPLPVIPQLNTFTITGNLTTNGAMPENFAQALNSRTAIATAPEGQTIQYKVLLLAASGATNPIAGASSESDGTSYTIKYTGTDTTAVAYWLRAVAYYMDGSDEVDILVSPDTQLETAVDLKGGVFTKDLEMRPATTGYGSASLTITLASATMCDSVTISDTTHFQVAKSGATVTITHKAAAVDNPKVACGSYPVTVNFYKTQSVNSVDTDVLVYQFDDVINIFNNLTTTVWVDNGNSPHLTTSGGVTTCSITDTKLNDFKSTNFYVDKNWTGTTSGTFAEPFDSLAYAINYINIIGNSTTTYTIHVKWITGNESVESTVNINKKIKIEVYKTIPGKKEGNYYLSCRNSLNITADGELTLVSDGENGLVICTGNSPELPLVSLSGKMIMYGGEVRCSGFRSKGAIFIKNNSKAILEIYGGKINKNDSGPLIAFEGSNGVLKVAKKPYIYRNITSNYQSNVNLPAGKTIQVVGPLEEGALIGVTTADPPTADHPVTITTGYGYQTGGYNAGQLPGKYFRGDQYGVTQDGDPNSGEAVLKLSGGNISTKVRDDITIDIDHTNASNNAADRKFTFTVTKDKGAVAPATSTDLTSAQGISYSYMLKDHADVISNSPTAYYNTSANTLTLNTNLPQGKYKLEVEVTWDGNKYQAAFDVGYVKTDVPSGCVAVLGNTWNSPATLCAGDADRQSKYFIAGRHLDIPDIIASDHEVTQTEFEQYMTYDPANTYHVAETGAAKDVNPVYYVDWYAIMVYCNLRTLDDETFGSTRDERLSHCVYSLNGSKDPELWLNSLISGSRIYKSGGKFYYSHVQQCNKVLDTTNTGEGYQFDLDADGWRLPTAVEWEYLARGGSLLPENQTIYSGSNIYDEVDIAGTIEIRTAKPNCLKIYNMSGNKSEWLWDRMDGGIAINESTPITGLTYPYNSNPNSDTYTGQKRAIGRAGNADQKIILDLPTYVYKGWMYDDIGFRVIRTVR